MDDPIDACSVEAARLVRPRTWHRTPAPDSTSNVAAVAGSVRSAALWNTASGQFNGVRLRAAIVARGWTVREFAATAEVSKGCLYKALGGKAVSDRTVLRIVSLLESRSPSGLIDG